MDQTTVSTTRLAFLLDATPKTIADYAQRGIVVRVGHGEYDLALSIRGVVAHLREMARGRGGELAVDAVAAERRRLLRAQADRAELQVQQERGQWLPRAEVLSVWQEALRTLRIRLLGLAPRLVQTCGLDNEAAERVDTEVREMLTELGRPQSYAPEVEVAAGE
jgi:phage terminase Nu1 subunit (DNA packaging protein)